MDMTIEFAERGKPLLHFGGSIRTAVEHTYLFDVRCPFGGTRIQEKQQQTQYSGLVMPNIN